MTTHASVNFEIITRDKWGFLCVQATCEACGKVRFVIKTNIIRNIQKGTYTGFCVKCRGFQTCSKQRGPKNPNWRGGRWVDVQGYVMLVLQPDHPYFCMCNDRGRAKAHRIRMAEHIGKPLTPESVVHHVDGDTQNNAISNLLLLPNQAEHMQLHARERASEAAATR